MSVILGLRNFCLQAPVGDDQLVLQVFVCHAQLALQVGPVNQQSAVEVTKRPNHGDQRGYGDADSFTASPIFPQLLRVMGGGRSGGGVGRIVEKRRREILLAIGRCRVWAGDGGRRGEAVKEFGVLVAPLVTVLAALCHSRATDFQGVTALSAPLTLELLHWHSSQSGVIFLLGFRSGCV